MGEEKEITTDTDGEKPELTKFGKFCQRHGINSNLIMLKITLFVMYGGRMCSLIYIISISYRIGSFYEYFEFAHIHIISHRWRFDLVTSYNESYNVIY